MSGKLPQLTEYNEAVQNPHLAFTDPTLRKGKVSLNDLGLPEPRCGGFALTYQVSTEGRDYAVRVFHKQTPDLEQRYGPISATLKRLQSPLFVDFEFQPNGIRVNGKSFPVVKMDWSSGETLGEFLENNYSKAGIIERVRQDILRATQFLRTNGIAHGDLQLGNILVQGDKVRLIDYDGMFVPGIASKVSSEIGHRHFQHPLRTDRHFDATLDRFSEILIDLSLEAIVSKPDLFTKFADTGEHILLTAMDFRSPDSSAAFSALKAIPHLRPRVEKFEALCLSEFEEIPTLADFNSGNWKPKATYPRISVPVLGYQGAFPVVDGSSYAAVASQVGNRVELIGQIFDIKHGTTRYRRRPYVFINFGPWQGSIAKITIWEAGLARLKEAPNASWKGRWISVTGLVDAPYSNARYNYQHVGVTVSGTNQIHFLTATEATYRLKSVSAPAISPAVVVAGQPRPPIPKTLPSPAGKWYQQPPSDLAANLPPKPKTPPQTVRHQPVVRPTPAPPTSNRACFVATVCYQDPNHPNLDVLRRFRDEELIRSNLGAALVNVYYRVGPCLAGWVQRMPRLREVLVEVLDFVVKKLRERQSPETHGDTSYRI